MKVAFGCDHGGFEDKEAIIKYLNDNHYDVVDFGTNSPESVDYPDIAIKVAEYVAQNEGVLGILVCGTGIGMSLAANKVKGIRCAHVNDEFSAEMTRRHNNANIIALGGRISTPTLIVKYVDIFLNTPFDGGRHQNRINKITEIENKYFK